MPPATSLRDSVMPGACWFPGARLNYAENLFARASDSQPMLIAASESGPDHAISWREVREQTARLVDALCRMGVQPGDRVAGYLPNIPEAVMAMLACASIGAIWSSCAPDFGGRSVLDRFTQIEPKVLIAVDGYLLWRQSIRPARSHSRAADRAAHADPYASWSRA